MIKPGESWPLLRLAAVQYLLVWTVYVVLSRCSSCVGFIFYLIALDYCGSVFEVDYPCLWLGSKKEILDIDDRTRYSLSRLRQWYF
jgi:hypothetical protein